MREREREQIKTAKNLTNRNINNTLKSLVPKFYIRYNKRIILLSPFLHEAGGKDSVLEVRK